MELRDLYDKNKKLTGEIIRKGDKIPHNRFILVVTVLIQNSKGELLIQQRSFNKGSYPGMWANTGGHPKSGETSIEGMITEIKEEIGIDVKENELDLIREFIEDDTFVDIYYINKDIDINETVLQEEEVCDIKWVTIEEYEKMIDEGNVANSHVELYELTKDFLKGNRKILNGNK